MPLNSALTSAGYEVSIPGTTGRRKVIISTDWWTDCDDVIAMAMAFELERLGLWDILGVAISTTLLAGPRSLDTLALFANRKDLPIFVPTTAHVPGGTPSYQTNMLSTTLPGGVSSRVTAPASTSAFNVPSATAALTQLLQNATSTVEIIEIGYPNVLHELLLAQPALVAQKVSRLWMMAGTWPNGSENNFNRTAQSRAAGNYVCANWPGLITFLGYEIGVGVRTGGSVYALGAANPVAKALIDYGTANAENTPYGRPSWDPMLMLLAACGSAAAGGYTTVQGTASVDAGTGANSFTPGPGRHEYVVRNSTVGDEYFVDTINDLIYPNTLRTSFTRADGTVFPSTASVFVPPSSGVSVDIADLRGHWNAQDNADLADTTLVDSVFDRVRNSTFTMAAAGALRPAMATKGGLRCWQFSGAQALTTAAYTASAQTTVYAKVWFDVAPAANQGVVVNENITPATPARSFQLTVASGIASRAVSFNNHGPGGTVDAANAAGITTGAWHVIALRRTNTQLEAFIDGVSNGPTNLTTAGQTYGVSGDSVAASLNIGARRSDASSEPLTGFVRSVRIYKGVHTDAQIAAVGAEM